MKNIKRKKSIILISFIVCLLALSYSVFSIILWRLDSNQTDDQIDLINKTADVTEVADSKNTQNINSPAEGTNSYWDYIKIPLINVNFDELNKINADARGWIQVRGTNINFPFVQFADNEYYLTHSFDKSHNQAGWAFLDYRNDINNLNKNSIIYAHGRIGETMFGTLKNIMNSNWYSNSDNRVIRLSTEEENTLWQVFSVYRIKTTNDYLQTSFSNKDDYQSFLNLISSRSAFEFNTDANTDDKILTLSTCYNKTEKVVMHAKLIKRNTK